MNTKNISIVISVYNTGPYIEACLNSVIGQGLPEDEYEIICINDGSSDNSQEILEQYASRYSNIRVIQQQNKGISAVRNLGINEARGKYLCFIDGDDFWLPNSFINVYRFVSEKNYWLSNGPDIILYGWQRVYAQSKTPLPSEAQPINAHEVESGYEFVSRFNFNNGIWYYLVKPDFIKQIGLKFAEGKLIEDGPLQPNYYLNVKVSSILIQTYTPMLCVQIVSQPTEMRNIWQK